MILVTSWQKSWIYDIATTRFTLLPALSGARAMLASAINASGAVVGTAEFDAPPGRRPVLWGAGTLSVRTLAVPLDADAYASDINDHGVIVGHANGRGVDAAFIWRSADASPEPLPLPAPRQDYYFAGPSAVAINDQGRVLGNVQERWLHADTYLGPLLQLLWTADRLPVRLPTGITPIAIDPSGRVLAIRSPNEAVYVDW